MPGELDYSSYLQLDSILGSQRLLSEPEHHDELLFIIQHQTAELWMKLICHELSAALKSIRNDELRPFFKILSRVKLIQMQLFDQWAVLETLTPSEFAEFRGVLNTASGLQSYLFKEIEMRFGNKKAEEIETFKGRGTIYTRLQIVLSEPGLYDEFLLYLARQGHDIPSHILTKDWSQPHVRDAAITRVFRTIYKDRNLYWAAYEMCEKLVDLREYFQLWRFRHLKTVERVIGFKKGTGGSSGTGFLSERLIFDYFPELIDVRAEI